MALLFYTHFNTKSLPTLISVNAAFVFSITRSSDPSLIIDHSNNLLFHHYAS